ncbi:MAG: hypothetical protein M5U26_21380 [Planctomycetota bacterium]|nr:hypothetical protein [Planctomycetota bacterium]
MPEHETVEIAGSLLAARIEPARGARIASLHWRPQASELLAVKGYVFALDPGPPPRGLAEGFRVIDVSAGHVEMECEPSPGLFLRTRYAIVEDLLFVRHRAENRGTTCLPLEPFTRAAWRLDAFGPAPRLVPRGLDMRWHERPLLPEGAGQVEVQLAEFDRPAGAWRLAGARLQLEETFSVDFVSATRLEVSRPDGVAVLGLHFKSHDLRPGTSRVFDTGWQVSEERNGKR